MRRISSLLTTKRSVLALVAVLGFAFVTFGVSSPKASAADCDANAIIKCGIPGSSTRAQAQNFIADVKANDGQNGHHDLKAIYADPSYGLSAALYNDFAANAVAGVAKSNGDIVVNGTVVGHDANSIGRLASYQGSGYFTKTIGGNTYYGNTNAKAFASSEIPVLVLFNGKGVLQFTVLTACGNPEHVTPVTPVYGCKTLQKAAVAGKANTYNFTAASVPLKNATIDHYTYSFGDGSPAVTRTVGSTAVQHTYTKTGTFTASVTITYKLAGGDVVTTVTTTPCTATIKVTPPPAPKPTAACSGLTGAILDASKNTYSFTATAVLNNGAVFKSADFNFGDNESKTGVVPTGLTATVTHGFAAYQSYTVTAVLHFNLGSTPATSTCSATVKPNQPPVSDCLPGIPVGDSRCTCQYNNAYPANDTEHCVPPVTTTTTTTTPPPATLVNTGAGDTIAIFAAVVVASFFIYRQVLSRRAATSSNVEDAMAIMIGQHMVAGAEEKPTDEALDLGDADPKDKIR